MRRERRAMDEQKAPWQPLYSVERAGITEIAVTGIVAASTGAETPAQLAIEQGDVNFPLWSRSLLKPIQLVSHIQILHENYPALRPEHFALMSSSHNAEPVHQELLKEIIAIGKIGPENLKCPAALPTDACTRDQYKAEGIKPQSLFHNCSAKHFGYMLSLQAQGKPFNDYIAFDNIEHARVDKVLSRLLGRPEQSFLKTTDGCQMPNHALSVKEMAIVYRKIAQAAGSFMKDAKDWKAIPTGGTDDVWLGFVGTLMNRFPHLLGGKNRLDTKIMNGDFTTGSTTKFLAKDGADGLLAVAALPTEKHPAGVGAVIKLSSGYEIRHMEALAAEVLRLLDIANPEPGAPVAGTRTDHIKTNFSLNLNMAPPQSQAERLLH